MERKNIQKLKSYLPFEHGHHHHQVISNRSIDERRTLTVR